MTEPRDADEIAYRPGRWWRVIDANNTLWCETSVEQEARDAMRPGDRIQRSYHAELSQWRDVNVTPPREDEA